MTQVTDVKPLLTVATYLDDASGFEVYQEITGKTFQPLEAAPAAVARASGGNSTLQLQTRGSKFVRFQELKLQERALEVRKQTALRSIPKAACRHLVSLYLLTLRASFACMLSCVHVCSFRRCATLCSLVVHLHDALMRTTKPLLVVPGSQTEAERVSQLLRTKTRGMLQGMLSETQNQCTGMSRCRMA